MPEGRFFQRLQHGCYAVPVFLYFFHCEANSVMRYALIYGKMVGEGRFYPESFVGAAFIEFFYFPQAFNNTGKHGVKFGVFAFCFGLVA
jgi:hypothetical protein